MRDGVTDLGITLCPPTSAQASLNESMSSAIIQIIRVAGILQDLGRSDFPSRLLGHVLSYLYNHWMGDQ